MRPRPVRVLGAVTLAAALAVGVTAPAYADSDPVIADGDFESVLAQAYTLGDAVGAWTVTDGKVGIEPGGLGENSERVAFYDFSWSEGFQASEITQTFETTVGGLYQLTYSVQGQFPTDSSDYPFAALVDGVNIDVVNSTGSGWKQRFAVFVADSTSTTLSLRSGYRPPDAVDNGAVAFVDNVSVRPLPAPVVTDGEFDSVAGSWDILTASDGIIGGGAAGWTVADGHASVVNRVDPWGNLVILNSLAANDNPATGPGNSHLAEVSEITQEIPVTPGRVYLLTFWSLGFGAVTLLDGAELPAQPNGATGRDHSYVFTATDSTSTITFRSPNVLLLDHVEVTELPDAPIVAPLIAAISVPVMLLVGAGTVLVARRRGRVVV